MPFAPSSILAPSVQIHCSLEIFSPLDQVIDKALLVSGPNEYDPRSPSMNQAEEVL